MPKGRRGGRVRGAGGRRRLLMMAGAKRARDATLSGMLCAGIAKRQHGGEAVPLAAAQEAAGLFLACRGRAGVGGGAWEGCG